MSSKVILLIHFKIWGNSVVHGRSTLYNKHFNYYGSITLDKISHPTKKVLSPWFIFIAALYLFFTCPIFVFYFFRIEFDKTHVAVRTLKPTKILTQTLAQIQPKSAVGSAGPTNPIILNPSNLNFNNSSLPVKLPPMVRNITAEETPAGTEISWEPPDEIADIKETDINIFPSSSGVRFGPPFKDLKPSIFVSYDVRLRCGALGTLGRFLNKTLDKVIYHVYPSKVVCLVQPGQDCWRSD